ncbi:SET domain-containing protein-lysine N-methyltransferase [Pantoea sp. App145]|uniref:SET domain-containing protein-lysine N-methyltransferase n=1 Tax=Pantoea sp. App145 TaxID=3071567 RepID=UPI003A802AE9
MAPLSPVSQAQIPSSPPQPGPSFDMGWHKSITQITNPAIESLVPDQEGVKKKSRGRVGCGLRASRSETELKKDGERTAQRLGTLSEQARKWLERQSVPEGAAKNAAVATLYKDRSRPKSVTQIVLAWYYGISRSSLLRALMSISPANITSAQKSFLHKLLPAENHPDAKTVAQLFIDNQQAMGEMKVTQRVLSRYYGIKWIDIGSARPGILTHKQETTLNELFPAVQKLTLSEVAQRYFDNQKLLVGQQISQRQLAGHCGINKRTLEKAIDKVKPVALLPSQESMLHRLLPLKNKPDVDAVARLFIANEQIFWENNINRRMLSKHYKVSRDNLVHKINWIKSVPLTAGQKNTLKMLLPSWADTKTVARLTHHNKALLESQGITVMQLAKYCQLHHNSLSRTISIEKPNALPDSDREWLDSLIAAKKKITAAAVARIWLDFKSALETRGITQRILAQHFKVKLSTLIYKIGCMKDAPLVSAQEIYLHRYLPLADGVTTSQVAELYVDQRRSLDWPGITTFQLAAYYKVNLNSLRADINQFQSAALTVRQINFLNKRLSPEDAPDAALIARLFLDHKDCKTWPKVSQLQLAKHYKIQPNSLYAEIKSLQLLAPPVTVIKPEPEEHADNAETVVLEERHLAERAQHYAGPLLRDPLTGLSLTGEKLGHWQQVEVVGLKTLPDAQQQAVLDQVRLAVKTDGKSDAARFARYLTIKKEPDDPAGNQIVAREDIPAGTCLGIYSGDILAGGDSLDAAIKKHGPHAIFTYLFATRQPNVSISGYQHPNLLALINTGHLPGYPARGENNVMVFYARKPRHKGVAVVYVTQRKISKGEELLIGYGPDYQMDIINFVHYQAVKNDHIRQIASARNLNILVVELDDRVRVCTPAGWQSGSLGDEVLPVDNLVAIRARQNKGGLLMYDALNIPPGNSGQPASWRIAGRSRDGDDNLFDALARGMSAAADVTALKLALSGLTIKQEL